MRGPAFLESLEAAVPGGVLGTNLEAIDPWVEVAPHAIADVARWLHDAPETAFDSLQCITAVDWLEVDP
ncbi:MAG: NADH-quinone oxidoreductase subunit C, partial [Pirellulales bacterium]